MKIRVAVADDHPIFLSGLEQLIKGEPAFELVAKCSDGEAVLAAVSKHSPDVLVLDLQMPGKSGLMIARELVNAGVNVRVILLTGSITDDEAVEALRLGVRGVLLKEMAPQMLLDCIRKVHAGGQWIERASMGRAVEKMLRREEAMLEIAGVLTKREIELVRLVARGLRNKEIAMQLNIKDGTVKMHLYSIFQKLKLSNRVELTLYARERGLG